jgi:hypothetical protein
MNTVTQPKLKRTSGARRVHGLMDWAGLDPFSEEAAAGH